MAAQIEKWGKPCVTESFDLPDIVGIVQLNMLLGGVPNARIVKVTPDTSILDFGPWVPQFIDGLTKPLTAEEAKAGTYTQPTPPRIAMTGTLDEIQAYFTGDLVAHPTEGPVAWMTDGLAIMPPTEAAVAQMLKGTSHKPTETITFKNAYGTRIATIEKIAVNAVMAGCKPEYLPVILTIAENGAAVGYSGDSSFGHLYMVSGPYGKEIGMNHGFDYLTANNPANRTIEHAARLMGINLGGCIHGVGMLERTGSNHWGQIFAEDSENTPYDTVAMHFGKNVTSDNSVLACWRSKVQIVPFQNIEVKSPTNLWECQEGGPEFAVAALKTGTNQKAGILTLTADTAKSWIKTYPDVAKSYQSLQDYLWDNVTWKAGDWYTNYWFVTHHQDVGIRKNPTGQRILSSDYLDLPPDTLVPQFTSPEAITIIVAGGSGGAWGFGFGSPTILYIDKWR